MNILYKALAASILIFATTVPATAAVSPNIVRNIHAAAGEYSFRVHVNGDTVTLTGWVEDSYAKSRAEYAAKASGATTVYNCLLLE